MTDDIRNDDTKIAAYARPVVALYAPNASDTAECDIPINATDGGEVASEVKFEDPISIVGFVPEVHTAVFTAAGEPRREVTPKDIFVRLVINQKDIRTLNSQGIQQPAGGGLITEFVRLSKIGIFLPRLSLIRLKGNSPVIKFVVRSAYANGSSSGFINAAGNGVDMIVSIGILWNRADDEDVLS